MTAQQTTQSHSLPPDRLAAAFGRALALARWHEGATAPNPPVGCVLLDARGEEIAAGAHRRAGTPHAEATALALARAAGQIELIDTVVVTLEPCNHHGRTPPCVDGILATPARQIWIACTDPNPKVQGGGAERLRSAGRDVHFLDQLAHPAATKLAVEAERLLAPFAKHSLTRRPFITIKQALARDGGMIPPPGHKTFTSAASLRLAHELRRRADAILTGSGTILADTPLFTVRHVPDHPDKQRLLLIADRRQRVPDSYLTQAGEAGFAVHLVDDVEAALEWVGAAGGLEVLVEAGPSLTASLLAGDLWDEHVLIEQAREPGDEDRVTVRRRTTSFPQQLEIGDVLRHH